MQLSSPEAIHALNRATTRPNIRVRAAALLIHIAMCRLGPTRTRHSQPTLWDHRLSHNPHSDWSSFIGEKTFGCRLSSRTKQLAVECGSSFLNISPDSSALEHKRTPQHDMGAESCCRAIHAGVARKIMQQIALQLEVCRKIRKIEKYCCLKAARAERCPPRSLLRFHAPVRV